MPPTTTGYNSTAQADSILTQLGTDLAGTGVSVITRGRLMQIPRRPCVVLVGPSIETGAFSFHQNEARYTWLLVIARDIADNDERTEEIDTWGDLIMASITDWQIQNGLCHHDLSDMPTRIEDQQLVEHMHRMGAGATVDATAIQFATRTYITPPACV
jgi:hypothetical protein